MGRKFLVVRPLARLHAAEELGTFELAEGMDVNAVHDALRKGAYKFVEPKAAKDPASAGRKGKGVGQDLPDEGPMKGDAKASGEA